MVCNFSFKKTHYGSIIQLKGSNFVIQSLTKHYIILLSCFRKTIIIYNKKNLTVVFYILRVYSCKMYLYNLNVIKSNKKKLISTDILCYLVF